MIHYCAKDKLNPMAKWIFVARKVMLLKRILKEFNAHVNNLVQKHCDKLDNIKLPQIAKTPYASCMNEAQGENCSGTC